MLISRIVVTLSSVLVLNSAAWSAPRCADQFRAPESKQHLIDIILTQNPTKLMFIKDAPVLAYRIKSDRFEDIPAAIARHLGTVDQTKYTPEYLRQNIGSVFALQMNGDKPDFYVIGKAIFEAKYVLADAGQIAQKNAKYLGKLSAQIPDLISSNDPNLIAVLKMAPVPMVRMSDLGYSIILEVTIESPWGDQTKPVGQDAFLAFDESVQQYYMINADGRGLPLSYVPAR